MSQLPGAKPSDHSLERSRITAGWPLLLAIAVWCAGLPLLPRLVTGGLGGAAVATLVGLALICGLAGGTVLLRMPADPLTAPFVALAAAVATLLAFAPLDRTLDADAVASYVLVAPWRYALTPLVVHFALATAWPHRRQRWVAWLMGWYAIQLGLLLVVGVGVLMGETPLVDAVDGIFRSTILEPVGAVVAVVSVVTAIGSPVRGRAQRGALLWVLAAVLVGFVPLVLVDFLPALSTPISAGITVARLALVALPLFGLVAAFSLPFRDAAARDLLGHRLASGVLEGSDLSLAMRQVADLLQQLFGTRGVAIQLADPDVLVSVGEVSAPASAPFAPHADASEDHDTLVLPIGRSGNPLGEVRLEGRVSGAVGPSEREWLNGFLQPIAAALRIRRRQISGERRSQTLGDRVATSVEELATAARELPVGGNDAGMAVPPPVDAREVLAQMSDGVTGIARHGEGLANSAGEARDRARGATDSIARGLDALAALHADVARLARYGDQIAASNDTVSGVAFRTNLVANNAALEATRAGAAGRTFGVLAEEVRRLADTTAATSVAIGEHTAALAADVATVGASLEGTRQALAAAIREAEAGEQAAQRLSEAAVELEDTARSLRPVVSEANAVAKRRSARDQHLTATLERFLVERAALARALTLHRDAIERLAASLRQLNGDR